jgi:hypothetical protein
MILAPQGLSDRSDGRGAMGNAGVDRVGCVGDCDSEGPTFALSQTAGRSRASLAVMLNVAASKIRHVLFFSHYTLSYRNHYGLTLNIATPCGTTSAL